MKRSMAYTAGMVMMFATLMWTMDAWARAGSSRSLGSRGSRSFSAPATPGSSPSSPSRQAVPPSGFQQQMPQRSGWMSGLMGGIGGFLLGGLIGSMLFGGMGHGLFGGIGFMEILLIGGLIFLAMYYLRRRQQPAPAGSYGYTPPYREEPTSWQSGSTATMNAPAGPTDLERGLEHIRQMDPAFDPARFASNIASDTFFTVQGAWMARTMTSARDVLTAEMHEQLQKECERLRAEHRIDRLENIAVRSATVTEAWQENGQDFVTVHFLASLIDYTVDDVTNEVVAGSRTEPVRFEEYWTFVRPVGTQTWRLSAIQQAA
jgi:predicted lipid-binding transport protein (Tim44 family)